jgi:hypothetical protein
MSWRLALAYGISWLYFFFTVSIIVSIFGKINGVLINYGISWVIMIILIYAFNPSQKLKEPAYL